MSAVVSAIEDVGNAIGDAVSTVGEAIQDAGDFIVDEVITPVANTVEKTIQAALDDPIGTAVKVAAFATGNPLLIAAANTTVALAHGADMNDALESGAKGYIAGQIGQGVGEYVAPQAAEFFGPENTFAANAATNAAANVSSAVALGQDPMAALIGSGISSSASEIAKNIPGFDQLSKSQQRAAISAIATTIQGKDPSQSLINEAIAGGIDAANNALKTPDTNPNAGYHDPVYDPPATVEQLNQELFPETTPPVVPAESFPASVQPTISDLFENTLPPLSDKTVNQPTEPELPAPKLPTPEVATPPEVTAEQQANQNMDNAAAKEEPPIPVALELPTKTNEQQALDDYYSLIGINPDSIAPATPAEYDPLAYLNQESTAAPDKTIGEIIKSLIPGGTTPNIDTSAVIPLLQNAAAIGIPAAAIASLLDQNGNPKSEADVAATAFNWNPAPWQAPVDGAAYGYAQLNPTYAANGGLMSLARGGISTLGGYSDGGRLLKGPGDGMSDNIPAMIGAKQPARLADGEFVVPADVVSHLGNGSTEAGANVLYKMMDKVRRARTGNSQQGKQINPKKFIPS